MATWKIEISALARRQIEKLEQQATRRIERFLHERIGKLDNPRSIGEALHGPELGKFWKYRVGDYRLICSIEDKRVLILVLRVGHRRQVYER
jgi:mRNA interferase RelE/StbE